MSLFTSLFRKKTVENILSEIQKGESIDAHKTGLTKTLTVKDLTAFGIAAIIGAGIFTTIGNVSAAGGPGVIFLFIFTALACGFSAFAYAEFASLVPVSGSAYTYSYVAFGELVAWLIGWSLIMEYSIGNIAVAIAWSGYFTTLLQSIHIPGLGIEGIFLPEWTTMDFLSAYHGFNDASALIASGTSMADLSSSMRESHLAWTTAPSFLGMRIIADLPALAIVILITWIVYRGIKESKNASNIMVLIKLIIILVVIAVGAFYVDTKNWSPFAPNGVGGILKGISGVFFAYIGFDAISTTAEECKNPQRDLPRGMMYSIIICTALYVAITLVLTGMVNYEKLGVDDPLAFVFQEMNIQWLSGVIAVSAVVAIASVLLVFQLGQPRIWMAMSRDGLLPKAFSRIHPKFNTPSFATVTTGFLVAVPALFMNLTTVTDLCSIGTLFAFVLVCGGVLKLSTMPDTPKGKFKTPYINSKYISPLLFLVVSLTYFGFNPEGTKDFFNSRKLVEKEQILHILEGKPEALSIFSEKVRNSQPGIVVESVDLGVFLEKIKPREYESIIRTSGLDDELIYFSGWEVFKSNIPYWIFLMIVLVVIYYSITKQLSLIPVLGLTSCLYMMSELGISNWIGFSIWLIAGLLIYFLYSYKNSRLAIKG